MIKKFAHKWQQFWWASIDPHALALLRISLGLFLLAYWMVYLPRVNLLFSENGLITPHPLFMDAALLSPPSLVVAYSIYAVCLLCVVGFTVGYHMRLAGLILATVMIYYYLLSFHNFPSSYNRLITITLVILSLSGADRTLSLRSRKTGGSIWFAERIPAWPARLLALQITATYLGVGLQKFALVSWVNGDILYYSLMGRWATDAASWFASLNLSSTFYDYAVEFIIFMEALLPIGLWLKRWQWFWFAMGAVFHILVTVFLGMWWFLVLIPCYIIFLKPDEVKQAVVKFCPATQQS